MKTYFFFLCLCLAACEQSSNQIDTSEFANGLFVCNEGIYGQTSGTVSFYNQLTKTVQNNLFMTLNNREIGNVLQSIYIYNPKIYLIVNNSNKIEVVNSSDFTSIAQITGFQQPRYFLPIDSVTAYVSQWGATGLTGSVQILNLNNQTIIGNIPLYKGSEKMMAYNQKVWVTHTGGYNIDNKIAIINPISHQLDTTLTVADNPHSLQVDFQSRIWIACGGKAVYANYPNLDTALSTAPALFCFDNYNLVTRIDLPKATALTHLAINQSKTFLFYVYNNQIFKFNINLFTTNSIYTGSFYGLQVIDDELYAARNAGISPAMVLRMDYNGVVVDSFSSGIFANGFYK